MSVFAQTALWLVVCAAPSTIDAQARMPALPSAADTNRVVSMALLDVTVVEALEQLAGAARISIVWQQASLGAQALARISCRVDGGAPEVMLRCITRAAALDYYRLSSGTYVVIAGAEAPPGWAAFGGFVVDAATGVGLPSARVQLIEAGDATFADDAGAFTIARLRPGRYAVTVRAIGYSPLTTTLDLAPQTTHRYRLPLTRRDLVARPIVVNGLRPGDASAALGASSLADSAMRSITGPSLFLPGAVAPLGVSRRDGVGDLHLQGGDVGEHPWRLDGIPLYDVTTLSGLLGVVSPLVVERMTVHRAGFGTTVGSFTSGVIDLTHDLGDDRSRAFADRGLSAAVAIDPLSATLRLSGPVAAQGAEGRVMLAVRSGLWPYTAPPSIVRAVRHWSVPDPVLLARVSGFAAAPGMERLDQASYDKSAGDESVSLTDVHFALGGGWGTAHQLSVSAFLTSQGISYRGTALDTGTATLRSTDAYVWRSTGGQVTHHWLLGSRVRQRLQLRAARHALDHGATMTMAATPLAMMANERNAMAEATAAADWRIQLSPGTTATLGVEASRAASVLDITNRVVRPIAVASTVWRGTVLADVSRQLQPTLFLDAGLRVTQLQRGQRFAEPRLSLRGESQRAGVPWQWRLAGGGYHQFVTQFDVSSTMPIAFVPSVRFWLPADGAIPVARAWHVAHEVVWRPAPQWELRGEGYFKSMSSIPTFDYGVMYGEGGGVPAGTLRDASQFVRGMPGWAQGAGLRVTHTGATRWQWRHDLAYDFGAAQRRFPSRFGGSLQPPPWLEPHRLLAVSEVSPWRGLTAAVRARGVWGRPWALRQVYYDLFSAAPGSSGLPVDAPGDMRRPPIVDVDVGATWRRRVSGVDVECGVSVTNVFDRANVLDYGLRRRSDGSGYDMVPRMLQRRMPVVTLQVRR